MNKLELVGYFTFHDDGKITIKIEDTTKNNQLLTANINLDDIDEYIAKFNEVMAKVKKVTVK